jgi:hypothetical protein
VTKSYGLLVAHELGSGGKCRWPGGLDVEKTATSVLMGLLAGYDNKMCACHNYNTGSLK